jgi:rfaE bifunctional protein nucleotidyltransferase chain/domain
VSVNELDKIVDISTLSSKLLFNDSTVGLCHGTFDVFHAGHVKYLQEAKSMCDILVVSVTADEYVKKGIGRPVFNQNDRMSVIASLECVDHVILSDDLTCVDIINKIKPNYYIKGAEFKSPLDPNIVSVGLRMEIDATTRNGGEFRATNAPLVTSKQKGTIRSDHRLDNNYEFINSLPYSYDDIVKVFDKCSELKVLVISDVIVDEYVNWIPMDRAPKTCILAGIQDSIDRMVGGGGYIASHAADYASSVTLLTRTGVEGYTFIEENIDSRINLVTYPCGDTATKTRSVFITSDGKPQVTSEICKGVRPILTDTYKSSMMDWVKSNIQDYDVIMIGDFGHGTIFPELVNCFNSIDKYKVVNVQSNESNIGFNIATKYNDIAYLTLDTYEAELALGKLTNKIDDNYIVELANDISNITNSDIVAITMGGHGTMMQKDSTATKIPVFTVDVLDAIGAGDVFMTISGIVGAVNNDPILMGFIGNCAGAIKVSNLCTSVIVTKRVLLEYISNLMGDLQ